MSDVQGSMFPELVDEVAVVPSEAPVSPLVPRPPGWVLVAGRGGVTGFHRVRLVNEYSTVVTLCGLKGHVVTESERAIALCAICEAGPPD